MSQQHGHAEPHAHHVMPLSIYWGVFIALVVGTIVTYLTAIKDFGVWNTPIALVIAVTKALLVILFFMHVKYQSKLMWLFVAAGFIWFMIMILFSMMDFATRGWD